MKMIIDISENEYRHIKEYYEKNDIVEATYSYIYHGKPLDEHEPKTDVLDKIRAEIEQMNNLDYVEPVTVDEIMQIIDKYKGESEDKE